MDKKTIMKKLNKNSCDSCEPIFFNGFKYGLKAEKIITVTDINSKRYFYIKWKNTDRTTLVETMHANKHCTSLVLKFYEGIVKWTNTS